jgi:hypothetical protein
MSHLRCGIRAEQLRRQDGVSLRRHQTKGQRVDINLHLCLPDRHPGAITRDLGPTWLLRSNAPSLCILVQLRLAPLCLLQLEGK